MSRSHCAGDSKQAVQRDRYVRLNDRFNRIWNIPEAPRRIAEYDEIEREIEKELAAGDLPARLARDYQEFLEDLRERRNQSEFGPLVFRFHQAGSISNARMRRSEYKKIAQCARAALEENCLSDEGWRRTYQDLVEKAEREVARLKEES